MYCQRYYVASSGWKCSDFDGNLEEPVTPNYFLHSSWWIGDHWPFHWAHSTAISSPCWLVSLIGRALHWYRRDQGFESRTSLNLLIIIFFFFFFRLSFRNCKSCVYNCDDHSSLNYTLRPSHIWFSYINNFVINIPFPPKTNLRQPTHNFGQPAIHIAKYEKFVIAILYSLRFFAVLSLICWSPSFSFSF